MSSLDEGPPAGSRDNLLTTPADEGKFEGSPYPQPGLRVRGTGGNPPFLVVEHYLERMILPYWPVRLWRVGNLESAGPENQINDWYTRVLSVEILEELPAWILFGPQGFEVAKIIEAADQFDEEAVHLLATTRADGAGRIYDGAWSRWEAQSNWSSPIGHGLILIHHAVNRSAQRAGPQLFRYDPVDEVDVLADPKWVAAETACLEAALGLGAPHLVDEHERALLTQPWRQWAGL